MTKLGLWMVVLVAWWTLATAARFGLISRSRPPSEQQQQLIHQHQPLLLSTWYPIGMRGGDESSEYDGDEDEEEMDTAQEDKATSMHSKRRVQTQQQPPPIRPVVDSRGHYKAPYIPRPKKKRKTKNLVRQIAATSLNLSKKAALTTVQTSAKTAFYLMRPKSIQRNELYGVWRLDQQVGLEQAFCNLELTPRGLVILRDSNREIVWKAPFRFVEPSWPQSSRVEFEARAFQPNNSRKKPRLLFYRGYLERKVADKSVIKMVGKLYEIDRPKSMFGKELPPRYTEVGSFVGRKRVVLLEEDEDEEEEDEYDDEEEEYEEEMQNVRPQERKRDRRRQPREEDDEDEEYDNDTDEL